MSAEKVNIAIIGAGRIGKLHAENLAYRIPNANPVAVIDIALLAAKKAAKDYGIPRAAADHRPFLEDAGVHAVMICSATNTHGRLIREAAAAGKHIFCEKPVAFSLQEIDETLAAVERAGVKLQVGFNRRFDSNFVRVKQAVAGGEIGQPHILRITSRDPAPPPLDYIRTSGGLFMDMAIHDFDMARFLIDSEIEEVYAVGEAMINHDFRKANDIDTAITMLQFENGALGSIDNSRKACYGYDQRVEVFGSEGTIMVSNKTPDTHTLMTEKSVSSAKPLYFFLERYRDSFVTEVQAFIDCILNDTDPPVTGRDGRAPVKIALAAQRSLTKHRPIKIVEIEP